VSNNPAGLVDPDGRVAEEPGWIRVEDSSWLGGMDHKPALLKHQERLITMGIPADREFKTGLGHAFGACRQADLLNFESVAWGVAEKYKEVGNGGRRLLFRLTVPTMGSTDRSASDVIRHLFSL
jgi:hypothetical protein